MFLHMWPKILHLIYAPYARARMKAEESDAKIKEFLNFMIKHLIFKNVDNEHAI